MRASVRVGGVRGGSFRIGCAGVQIKGPTVRKRDINGRLVERITGRVVGLCISL